MNTKRILVGVVTGALLTGSLMAASGNDQARSKTKMRASKHTATTAVSKGTNRAITNRRVITSRSPHIVRENRQIVRGNPRVVRGTTGVPVRTRTRVVTGNSFVYPYYGGYSYYGGYPYYGYNYGPSISFGFGYPYSYGYYPYGYSGSYPYGYNYGYYSYNQPGYTYGNASVVIAVQTRLARAGYYHGRIDGVMGPGTRWAIRAYERDHGLRVDGTISGPLMRNMGIRY